MAKRFTDTDIWTNNLWYRELSPDYKCFWNYIKDRCSSIGIWEVDFGQASYFIGKNIDKEKAIELFKDKVKILNGGSKWWIIYFCLFQYGILEENNRKSKPVQFYVKCLKFNKLWSDYVKTIDRLSRGLGEGIDTLKEKEKDKEKDKDVVKDLTKARKQSGKPSIQEVKVYAESLGFDLDAEHFYHHYEANGWRQGNGRPIVNWRSAVVTWKKQSGRFNQVAQGKGNKLMPSKTKYQKFGNGGKK